MSNEPVHPDSAVTLLEMMIAVSLVALVSLAIFGINYFGQFQISTAGRWARVQSEVSYFLEHLAKTATRAINNNPTTAAVDTITGGITIWIDSNSDSQLTSSDRQVAYVYSSNVIRYYPDFLNSSSYENLTANMILPDFTSDTNQATWITYSAGNNYFEVQVTGCYDIDGSPKACGDTENPSVVMRSRIQMPAVSTN